MSTPQRRQQTVPLPVLGLFLVTAVFLIGSTVYLLLFAPDELFTAILALIGGVTLLAAAILPLTWGSRA